MLIATLLSPVMAASLDVYPGDDVVTLTESLSAGSEVIFHDGTYGLTEALYLYEALGTADQPIVLRAAEGEAPVLEMTELGNSYLLRVEESAHVQIQGLTFRGADGWEDSGLTGVQILGSDFVTLADCEITRVNSTAVYVAYDTEGVAITGNHIHAVGSSSAIYVGHSDASYFSIDPVITGNWIHDVGDEYDWGIYLAAGTQGATVRDNVLYDIRQYGVHVNATSLGDANTVEGNAIWNITGADRALGMEIDGPAVVRNNLVFRIDGFGVYTRNNGFDQFEDVVISFNTVADTAEWAIYINDWAGRPGMVFANNAVANPTGYAIYAGDEHTDAGNYISANVVTGLIDGLEDMDGAYWPGGGYDDYADVEGWDFYPVSGSNLVNSADPAGEAWVPQADFNGAPREGDAPDVGAYEYSSGDNPGWAIREGFKDLTLDEASGEQVTGGGCCSKDESSTEAGLLLLPGLLLGMGVRRRRGQRPRG